MIDLNYRKPVKKEKWQPEEVAVAVIAILIWIPMAFIIGGLL